MDNPNHIQKLLLILIIFLFHKESESYHLHEKIVLPKVRISFPEDFADVDFQNETQALISNSYPAFDLTCNASYPIQWSLFHQEDDDGTSVKKLNGQTMRLVKDFVNQSTYSYSAVLSLQYTGKIFVFSNFSCVSTTDEGLQTNVILFPQSRKNFIKLLITNDKKYYQFENKDEELSNNSCSTFVAVSDIDKSKPCWNCETDTGLDLKLDFIGCNTPMECKSMYKKQNRGKKCLRIITNDTASANAGCKIMGALNFSPKAIVCKNYGPALVQFYYFGIPSMDKHVAAIYFDWTEIDPQKMIHLHPITQTLFFGQNITITCETSKYYFSKGSWFGIVANDKVQYFQGNDLDERTPNELESNESKKPEVVKGVFISSINLTLSNPAPSRIICFAPVWNSTIWINATINLEVKLGKEPKISQLEYDDVDVDEKENYVIGQTNRSLTCHFNGSPTPEVTWDGPSIAYDIVETDVAKNISKLTFPEVTYTAVGDYKCIVKSFLGSDIKSITLTVSKESRARFIKSIISVACIGFVVIGIVVALVVTRLWRIIKRQREALRLLTDSEIKEFVEGNPDIVSKNVYFDSNLVIDSLPYDRKYEVSSSQLSIDQNILLGIGAFGKVYKGKLKRKVNRLSHDFTERRSSDDDNAAESNYKCIDVAIKTCDKSVDVMYFKALLSEVKIMAYIGHDKNIVSLIGASTQNIRKRELYLAVEYCPKGSLESFLRLHKNTYVNKVKYGTLLTSSTDEDSISTDHTENVIYNNLNINEISDIRLSTIDLLKWVFDVANGMDYLFLKKVIHGDLAVRNILLTEDMVAKIGDFGLSRQLVECSHYVKKTQAPLPWRHLAPESLRNLEFSAKSDAWGFAVLMWEIFSLAETPFGGMSYNNLFIVELERGFRLTKPIYLTNDLYEYMLKCWNINPELRPIGFTEIKSLCVKSLKMTAPTGTMQDYLELYHTVEN